MLPQYANVVRIISNPREERDRLVALVKALLLIKRAFKMGQYEPSRREPVRWSSVIANKVVDDASRVEIPRGFEKGEINDMATVVVGRSAKRFTIQRSVLLNVGGFFRAALSNDGFLECVTKKITLLDEDIAVFERFVVFAYTGDFRFDGENELAIDWTTLIDLFSFAERRLLPRMQNAVIKVFAVKIDWHHDVIVPPKILQYLYTSTLDGSPLRTMAIDSYAWNLRVVEDKSRGSQARNTWSMPKDAMTSDFPSEFMFDVLKEVIKKAATLGQARTFGVICDEYYVKDEQ